MPDSQKDTIAENARAAEHNNLWPPLPEPSNVRHVTMSGGLFGGLDVIRAEYIDRSRPRRGWLYRLFHRRERDVVVPALPSHPEKSGRLS
jgi:hypothetical protein